MYANFKKIPLDDVSVELTHDRQHAADCQSSENEPRKIEVLERVLRFKGSLSDEQREWLTEIADRCPVHRALEGDLKIQTDLIE